LAIQRGKLYDGGLPILKFGESLFELATTLEGIFMDEIISRSQKIKGLSPEKRIEEFGVIQKLLKLFKELFPETWRHLEIEFHLRELPKEWVDRLAKLLKSMKGGPTQ
jgi:hypothetical protein